LFIVGCSSYIPPSDQLQFRANYLNADAMNTVVQKDPNVPDYLKIWMCEEVKMHSAYVQYSKGKGSLTPADPNAPK